ncbi:MAG TPA: type ISP restriction/modification enzyme, partial [Terriglobia bacterium]|nr:type ISP restriction/modification enzyme [Terriglobia bacterium]
TPPEEWRGEPAVTKNHFAQRPDHRSSLLKSDFPRVPLISNLELFRSRCGMGGELVALHLLESPKLEKLIARFPIKGPNLIEKGFPKYVAPGEPEPGTGKPVKECRVYINRSNATVAAVSDRRDEYGVRERGTPGFALVLPLWKAAVRDCRGRTLNYDELEHYCKVVMAVSETIRLMAAIDAAIPKWPIE